MTQTWPEVPDILYQTSATSLISCLGCAPIFIFSCEAQLHIFCEREGEGEVPAKPCLHVSTMFSTTGGADFFSAEIVKYPALAMILLEHSASGGDHMLGTEKAPKRNCVTKILPNVRVNFLVNFLVRLASKPLLYW